MTFEEWKKRYSVSMNPQQEKAIRSVNGPVLLLAVPGSGKTTVLIMRLGYMIFGLGIPPENILTVTYTVSATLDMRRRFSEVFGEEIANRLEFRTINGLSAKIIRFYEQKCGREAFDLVSDERTLLAVTAEVYRELTGEIASESTIKTLRTGITYIKNMQMSPEQARNYEKDNLPIGKVCEAYNQILRNREWMDYDDQMVYAYRILKKKRNILEYFQTRYQYLCVDEAQDTSYIQHNILRLLAAKRKCIFMVGDEDQSIYGFRAAYPTALMQFEKQYPGGQVLLMEKNYRSTRQITETADRFIRKNQERRDKHMISFHGDGPDIQGIWMQNRSRQYDYLVKVAQNPYIQTAVLYRNHESILPVIDLFERNGLPYHFKQTDVSFFSHRNICDFRDFVRLAQDPTDGDAFLRIYYKFSAGISRIAAEGAVKEASGSRNILEVLLERQDISLWTKEKCKSLLRQFSVFEQERADRAVYRMIHNMGYGEYLKHRGADIGKMDILEALGRLEDTPETLVERLDVLYELLRSKREKKDGTLYFSTIHSSKGLEYDRVILLDVIDGILPCRMPDDKEEAENLLEEERRLFYVAMTRAKKELQVFRFRDSQLPSSFSDSIFPKEHRQQPRKAEKVRKRNSSKPERLVQPSLDSFKDGVRVRHNRFGTGRIVGRQGDIVTVLFDDGEEKRISLSASIKRNIMRSGEKEL